MIPAAAHMAARYGEIDMPVRIFAGSDDLIVDAESQSGRLFKDIGHSVLAIILKRVHMVHYADAERIGDAVEAMGME